MKIVEGEDAMDKPAIKLFNWKKAALILTLCVGTVCDTTYHAYRQKGHLDSGDWWAASMTMVIVICAVGFVGWWANREE